MNPTPPQTHPAPETWADYLYGELPPDASAEVDDHVRACPACQRQLSAWRETQGALDAWKLPASARRIEAFPRAARWAVAAAAVLGLGWVGGRLSLPTPPDPAQLRAAMAPALKQELRQEFQAELAAAIKNTDQRADAKLVELAQAWAATRAEDQEAMRTAYQRADLQRRTDYATLRRDLETVAVVAQAAIGTTQEQLTQLAGNTTPAAAGDGGLPR